MEDRAAGYEMSDISRLPTPHLQQDARSIVAGQRKKHPASEPEALEPQRSRVRRASVDEDRVYWPWIELAAVGSDYTDAVDRRKVRSSAGGEVGVQFNSNHLTVRRDDGRDDRRVVPRPHLM